MRSAAVYYYYLTRSLSLFCSSHKTRCRGRCGCARVQRRETHEDERRAKKCKCKCMEQFSRRLRRPSVEIGGVYCSRLVHKFTRKIFLPRGRTASHLYSGVLSDNDFGCDALKKNVEKCKVARGDIYPSVSFLPSPCDGRYNQFLLCNGQPSEKPTLISSEFYTKSVYYSEDLLVNPSYGVFPRLFLLLARGCSFILTPSGVNFQVQ